METRSRNEDDKLSTEPGQLHNVIGQRHGGTVAVDRTVSAYIDIDNFGRVTAVEILGPPPELRAKMIERSVI